MWRGAVCVLLAASGTAQAEPFVYRGQQLTLAGTAQACYLRFVDLFDAEITEDSPYDPANDRIRVNG